MSSEPYNWCVCVCVCVCVSIPISLYLQMPFLTLYWPSLSAELAPSPPLWSSWEAHHRQAAWPIPLQLRDELF